MAVAAMDRWLGPVLAREAGRHHADYAAYRAPRRAFSSELERLPQGSVLEPSPLLGYSADTILLHFEWSPESGAHSLHCRLVLHSLECALRAILRKHFVSPFFTMPSFMRTRTTTP